MLNRYLIAATLAGAALLGTAASAATSLSFDSGNIGTTYSLTLDGRIADTVYPDLSAAVTIKLLSIDNINHAYNFAFALDNTSSAFTNSRVSIFAFDVTSPIGAPTVSGFGSNSVFKFKGSGQLASIGPREVCLRAGGGGNNCAGGGSGGVDVTGGYSSLQLFTLAFASTPLTVTLDNFGIKYQSIDGIRGVTSAEGIGTVNDSVVPEPATWALMIAGFGMVGAAARRRRPAATVAA